MRGISLYDGQTLPILLVRFNFSLFLRVEKSSDGWYNDWMIHLLVLVKPLAFFWCWCFWGRQHYKFFFVTRNFNCVHVQHALYSDFFFRRESTESYLPLLNKCKYQLEYELLCITSSLEVDGCPSKENFFGQSTLLMNATYFVFPLSDL